MYIYVYVCIDMYIYTYISLSLYIYIYYVYISIDLSIHLSIYIIDCAVVEIHPTLVHIRFLYWACVPSGLALVRMPHSTFIMFFAHGEGSPTGQDSRRQGLSHDGSRDVHGALRASEHKRHAIVSEKHAKYDHGGCQSCCANGRSLSEVLA
jgi:hypothetical protein